MDAWLWRRLHAPILVFPVSSSARGRRGPDWEAAPEQTDFFRVVATDAKAASPTWLQIALNLKVAFTRTGLFLRT